MVCAPVRSIIPSLSEGIIDRTGVQTMLCLSLKYRLRALLYPMTQFLHVQHSNRSGGSVVEWITCWNTNPGVARSILRFSGHSDETLNRVAVALVVGGVLSPSSLTHSLTHSLTSHNYVAGSRPVDNPQALSSSWSS